MGMRMCARRVCVVAAVQRVRDGQCANENARHESAWAASLEVSRADDQRPCTHSGCSLEWEPAACAERRAGSMRLAVTCACRVLEGWWRAKCGGGCVVAAYVLAGRTACDPMNTLESTDETREQRSVCVGERCCVSAEGGGR